MHIKPFLSSLVIAFGLTANAAPKVPKPPKATLKKEAELTKCQAQMKALNSASSVEERAKAAQCQLWLGEQGYAKFSAIKPLKVYDAALLKTWLEDSKKQREEASALYLKVKNYKDPAQSVAALARIGLMSYQVAVGIQNAPMPTTIEYDSNGDGTPEKSKLTGETKTQVYAAIKAEQEKLSSPLLEEAKKTFEACAQEAKDGKINNSWSKLCSDYSLALTPPAKAEPTPTEKAPSNGLPKVEKKKGGVVKEN